MVVAGIGDAIKKFPPVKVSDFFTLFVSSEFCVLATGNCLKLYKAMRQHFVSRINNTQNAINSVHESKENCDNFGPKGQMCQVFLQLWSLF
jgi:hypothetical protein